MAPGAGASAVKPRETAIVGDPDAADTQALLNVVREGHSPFQVVALGSPHGQHPGRDDMQLTQARQLPSNAESLLYIGSSIILYSFLVLVVYRIWEMFIVLWEIVRNSCFLSNFQQF